MSSVTERLTLTAVYEPAEDGWISARVLEVPGVNTCGRNIEEARGWSATPSG